jgi:hypothetical protein
MLQEIIYLDPNQGLRTLFPQSRLRTQIELLQQLAGRKYRKDRRKGANNQQVRKVLVVRIISGSKKKQFEHI